MGTPKVKHIPHITMIEEGQLLYINGELYRYTKFKPFNMKTFIKLTTNELAAVEGLLAKNRELAITHQRIQEALGGS